MLSFRMFESVAANQTCIQLAFFQEFFSGGRGTKPIVMKISFVMLILLLFSDQSLGGQMSLRGAPPAPRGGKPEKIGQTSKPFPMIFTRNATK